MYLQKLTEMIEDFRAALDNGVAGIATVVCCMAIPLAFVLFLSLTRWTIVTG
jgi:hypothetical protein